MTCPSDSFTILECIEKILGNLIETLGLNIDDVVAGILRDNDRLQADEQKQLFNIC